MLVKLAQAYETTLEGWSHAMVLRDREIEGYTQRLTELTLKLARAIGMSEAWEIMQKHPGYAYEMLSPIHYLKPALPTPYFHHEKWDGSGYSLGLRGEQIPLDARVFSVIDVWEALLCDRPYRNYFHNCKSDSVTFLRIPVMYIDDRNNPF